MEESFFAIIGINLKLIACWVLGGILLGFLLRYVIPINSQITKDQTRKRFDILFFLLIVICGFGTWYIYDYFKFNEQDYLLYGSILSVISMFFGFITYMFEIPHTKKSHKS